MKKRTHFGELGGPGWPEPRMLERYFLDPSGDAWPHEHGNDSWGLSAEGLYGTDGFPDKDDGVSVYLSMTGYPELGVSFGYARWDGRTRKKIDYQSIGDPQKEREVVYTMQGDPMSVGSFVSYADAYQVVKEFIETGGELPTCIKWGPGSDIPQEAFFYPGIQRW